MGVETGCINAKNLEPLPDYQHARVAQPVSGLVAECEHP